MEAVLYGRLRERDPWYPYPADFNPVLVNRLYAAGVVDGAYQEELIFEKIRTETEYEVKRTCRERFEPAVQAIRQLQKEREASEAPILVAIDGRCGSGKTTLGEYLGQVFDCNVFRMDDFFLRMEQRTPERDGRDWRQCGL